MLTAIIILNYCTFDDVVRCVDSVRMSSINKYKIYIIDNKSKDNSGFELNKKYQDSPNVSVFLNDENQGYSGGNNIGINMALKDNCDFFIIANPDIIFLPNSIDILISTFKKNNKIGLVGPKILNTDGSISKYNPRKKLTELKELYFLKVPIVYLNFNKVKDKMFYTNTPPNQLLEVFTTSGSCLAFSLVAIKEIFPLDEKLFMYMEEPLIGKRLSDKDLKVIYNPYAEVIHDHRSEGRLISASSLIYKCASEIYYIRKILGRPLIWIMPIIIYYFAVYIIGLFLRKDYREKIGLFFRKIADSFE